MSKKTAYFAVEVRQEDKTYYLVGAFGRTDNRVLASRYSENEALKHARKYGNCADLISYKELLAGIPHKKRVKLKLAWVERYLQRARAVLLESGIDSSYNISRRNVPYISLNDPKLGVVTVSYFMGSLFFRVFHKSTRQDRDQYRMDFATPQDIVNYLRPGENIS